MWTVYRLRMPVYDCIGLCELCMDCIRAVCGAPHMGWSLGAYELCMDCIWTLPPYGMDPRCIRTVYGMYMDCAWLYIAVYGCAYCIWVCITYMQCIRTVYRLYAPSATV